MAGPVAAFLTKTFGTAAAKAAFAASKAIPLWASVTAHVIVAGASMVGSALLAPKNRFGQGNDRNSLTIRGANSLGATTNRQYIYGQVKVGGTIVYMGTSDYDGSVTGNDNRYLHMVLVHCDHETEELGDLYVNGEVVSFSAYSSDGALRSATGTRYSGSLWIADHHGGPSQTVNSTLDAAMGNWGSNDKLSGMSYTYIRLLLKDGDDNAFPTGIPQFQRVVKGRKVYDPREASHDADDSTTWEYSSNWALCVADYLQSEFGYGRVGLGHDKINETELIASANNSDETVNSAWDNWSASEDIALGAQRLITEGAILVCRTAGTTGSSEPAGPYSGGETDISDGTVVWDVYVADSTNTENRYELNGIVNSDEDPMEVVRSMRTAADGLVEYIGGEWFVRSGRYITPTITLDESDFAGPISGTTKDDRTVSVNTIKGVIVNKDDAYNVIDVPQFTNSTYVTQDNGIVSTRELELLFTNSPAAAQRLFKIALAKARQQISHKATFTAKAMQLQVGDNFKLDFAKYGYSSTASTPTTFQVWSHQLKIGGNGELLVEMEFREIASNTYDWDATTDQTPVDPAPTSFLPDPFTVSAPSGFSVSSGTNQLIESSDGSILPSVLVTWTGASDVNVIGYQLRWKYANASTDTNYRYLTVNGRNNTSVVITGVRESRSDANRYIDIDIRSITPLKEGEWTVVEHDHDVIGKSAAPTDPSGPTVSAVENGVTVTFSEHPDLDFFNYHIWVQTSSSPPTHTGTGPFSPTATTSTSGLSKTILGLDPSTTYYVFTAAMDSSRLFSDIVATTPATISPSAISDDGSLGALATEDSIDLGTEGNGGVTTGTVLPVANTEATDNGTTIDTSGDVNAAIDFTASGAIKHGKTSSDDASNAGFWLGEDGQATPDYDFHIGDSSNSLKWDGSASTLTVKGDLTAGSVDIGTGFSRTEIASTGVSSWAGGRIQINASDSAFGDVGQKWTGSPIESIWIDCNTTSLPANLYFGNVSTGAANAFITGQGNAEFKTLDVTTSLDLNSSTLDASNGVGSSGQVLSSTGSGTQWIDSAAGLWTQSGSDIYYNSGGVGIGTTSPSDELHVVGVGKITTAVLTPIAKTGNASGDLLLQGGNTGGAHIHLYGESHSTDSNDAAIDANMLTVRNAAGSTTIAEFDSSEVDIKNRLKVDIPSNAWTTSTSWYSVSDGGSNEYGSLTTSGSYAVTLNGNGYRSSGTGSTSWVSHEASPSNYTGATQIWQYPAGYMTFNANSSWPTGSSNVVSERMRIFGDGDVSIGTTSSGYKLRVEGDGYFADRLTLGDVGSEGGELAILDHNNASTQQLTVDVDSVGNSRVFQLGNGNLHLGNLTGGTGETRLYANADAKVKVKSTQTEITDQLYVSGYSGSDSIVTINGIDCGGGMLVQGSLDVDVDLDVSGTKNFRIAHPVRDGHDLRHTCVESPQADLTYRGQATLVDGTVQVDLDSEFGMTAGTFAALNDDVQVFAQNESGWDAVRGSVSNGVLTIDCENPDSTDSVAWLVIGRRTGVELEIEPKSKIK